MKQKSKLKFLATAIAVAVMTSASVGAQEKKLHIYTKDGGAIYSGTVSGLDSVIMNRSSVSVVPSKEPDGNTGKVKSSLPVGTLTFMNYNLGATAAYDTPEEQMAYTPKGDDDATVYGGLFQWGRPADGHQDRTSGSTSDQATSVPVEHALFITKGTWLNPADATLWGKPKTLYDPCPEGWRIPTKEEWESIFSNASGNTIAWNLDGTKGVKFSPDGGATYTLFLPCGGMRQSGGKLNAVGSDCFYWSSTASYNSYSERLRGTTFDLSVSESSRGSGNSCRCLKEY